MGSTTQIQDRQALEAERETLRERLVSTGEMRPGSLVEQYRKCGKANCHCAKAGANGHGPNWILTRAVGGKTVTRSVAPRHLERTRAQLDEHRRFREVVHKFVDVNARLCDAKLQEEPSTQPEVKKGGSKRPSRKRSSRKSKR